MDAIAKDTKNMKSKVFITYSVEIEHDDKANPIELVKDQFKLDAKFEDAYFLMDVSDVKEGDQLDLENDEFADPFSDKPVLKYQYVTVESTYSEKNRFVIYSDVINVAFPLGHKVKVTARNTD